MKKADKKVTVGMPQGLYDALRQMAEEDSWSISNFIRQILWAYVEKKSFERTAANH